MGHSTSYCGNKARCAKCGGDHALDACEVTTQMCVHCGQAPHELSSCSTYKERSEKLKRSLKNRSQRSYAEMVKKTSLANENLFAPLSEGECENDVVSGSVVDARPGNFKRNSETSRKSGNSAPSGTKSSVKTPIGSAGRNPKQASGCKFKMSPRCFQHFQRHKNARCFLVSVGV